MSSVPPPPESMSRAARLDRILRELLHQTPGVEAAAVVSFDGLPMASALPVGMDEDRVAAMSAALLSLAERAAQDLGRGDLSQVYIEGENGAVFLISAQDEGVLIAVTSAGTKVGMMLYEVKLAANRVGEVLHGPAPLPAPLPAHLTRSQLDGGDQGEAAADAAYNGPAYSEPAYNAPAYVEPAYVEPARSEPPASEPVATEPAYDDLVYRAPVYSEQSYAEQSYAEQSASEQPIVAPSPAVTESSTWSSYAPTGSVLPGGSVLPADGGAWS
jgi:uncharacterized protein